MKTSRISVLAIVLSVLVFAGRINAVEMTVDFETELKASSAFVWRGQILNDEPCIQPSLTASAEGFTLNIWGSWNMTSISNAPLSSRVDTTAGYTWSTGRNIMRAGLVGYLYHDDPSRRAKDTFECFAGYTLDALLLPSLTVYYDFGDIQGFIVTASVAHSVEVVRDKIALDLKLLLDGADSKYANARFAVPGAGDREAFSPDKTALLDCTAIISLPIKTGKQSVLTPEIRYMTMLDSSIKGAFDAAGQDTSTFMASVAFGMTF